MNNDKFIEALYEAGWRSNCDAQHENIRKLLDECSLSTTKELPWKWLDGAPQRPWSTEWFLAKTTFGDRVVLRALPEEYSYDFKTADDTYIKADKIKQWAQFPDSHFIAAGAVSSAAMKLTEVDIEKVEHAAKFLAHMGVTGFAEDIRALLAKVQS